MFVFLLATYIKKRKKEPYNQRYTRFLSLSCRPFYLFSATIQKKEEHDYFQVNESCFLDKHSLRKVLDYPVIMC